MDLFVICPVMLVYSFVICKTFTTMWEQIIMCLYTCNTFVVRMAPWQECTWKEPLDGSEIIDFLNADWDFDIIDDTDKDPTHSEDENSGKLLFF